MPIGAENIKTKAAHLGFSFCGIAEAAPLSDQRSFYEYFIRKKLHCTLSYLETNLETRLDPLRMMPDARSVIAVLLNYYPDELIPDEDNFIISKYAYGRHYHHVMRRTHELADFIRQEDGKIKARAFADSGTVMEKVWAQRCGLGWQGKNTLLINKNAGSFFFIGIILTNLDLLPDKPETDHCSSCDKCIKACPTGALRRPYELDISKCISYRTIESKVPIPEELKGTFNDRIYGCDICQDVCPFNKFARPAEMTEFSTHEALKRLRKKDWMALTELQFKELFKDSAIARTGYIQFMKNIRFVSSLD